MGHANGILEGKAPSQQSIYLSLCKTSTQKPKWATTRVAQYNPRWATTPCPSNPSLDRVFLSSSITQQRRFQYQTSIDPNTKVSQSSVQQQQTLSANPRRRP